MTDPVSATEAALLARDRPTQPWQQAVVVMLAGELSRSELLDRIRERIDFAPRFRKVTAGWPLQSWVDDQSFSLGGHVRETRLERGEQLETWLADRLAAPLDPDHPRWQAALIRGVAPGATALVVRTHPGLVDGYDHVHLLQELFDEVPERIATADDSWRPSPAEPFGLEDVWNGVNDPVGALLGVAEGLGGLVENSIRAVTAESRRHHVAGVEVDLDALAEVRQAFGCTTHDVLLALATAGARGWQVGAGADTEDLVALVPLAVAEPAVLASSIGCRVAPSWIALPTSVASSTQRLADLATLTRARIDSGVSVAARDLVDLAGFAVPTLHAVAAGTVAAGRTHSVYLANVPGPERPRYLGQARVRRVYVVTGTTDEQQLSVSITSYAGRVTLCAVAVSPLSRWAQDVATELEVLRKGVQ